MIQAGKFDRIITIERATTIVDEYGTPQRTWAEIFKVYAQMLQQSTSTAMLKGYGEDAQNLVAFRVRFIDGITLEDRVTYQGQSFDMKEIKEIGRREALELRVLAVTET